MRKALSCFLTFLMTLSLLQVRTHSTQVNAAEANANATFIANRFVPVGFGRDGESLDGRTFPWQRSGETVWGRMGYGMPDALMAIENEISIPADLVYKQAEPLFWNEFYLVIEPKGGQSQESEHWYAVYDSAGQLWLDPDGRFNDARYYEPADPTNLNGKYITGLCLTNPLAKVDPSTGNNTQGPYIFEKDNPRFNLFMGPNFIDENGQVNMYFWDLHHTKRVFKMGWADMVDFPLTRGEGSPPPLRPSIVQGDIVIDRYIEVINGEVTEIVEEIPTSEDWDAVNAFPLIDFCYWGMPGQAGNRTDLAGGTPTNVPITQPAYNLSPDKNYRWYYNSGLNDSTSARTCEGDELHADNVSSVNQNSSASDPVVPQGTPPAPVITRDLGNYYAKISDYDPGEYIYRKGEAASTTAFPSHTYDVQEGDLRLTPVSIYYNGEVRNYAPNSYVKAEDWDCAWDLSDTAVNSFIPAIYKNLYRFRIKFENDGRRVPSEFDEVHVDNVKMPEDSLWDPGWFTYESDEWIYREKTEDGFGFVSVNDERLTNVNSVIGAALKKDRTRGYLNADVQGVRVMTYNAQGEEDAGRMTPRVYGDLLLLAEVIYGGCNQAEYNLSVETDVWGGEIPDITAASLRTPNGDFEETAQSIQRNTVLDPTGTLFYIPATTFHNISLLYREFIGVQIWKDNGIDNNYGINFMDNPPPPIDKLFKNNLADDYNAGRTGEEYLGNDSSIISDKDLNRRTVSFPREDMYVDIPPIAQLPGYVPVYGCGESIYRNVNTNMIGGFQVVNDKDIRLTQVTVSVGNVINTYEAGSTVTPGDADYGFILNYFQVNNVFFDREWPDKNIPLNYTYDVGEDIYATTDFDWAELVPPLNPTPPLQPNPAPSTTNPVFFGTGLYDNILYYDHDQNGMVTAGDIRIVDLDGYYAPGSVIGSNIMVDLDLTSALDNVVVPIRAYLDNGYLVAAYADIDDSMTISTGDIRFNKVSEYSPYTVVQQNDKDNNDPAAIPPETPLSLVEAFLAFVGLVRQNQLLVGVDLAHVVRITPYFININDGRLTSVTISDAYYECGSIVGAKMDYWINENIVHGFSMGKNSNSRYIDWPVLPSDKVGLQVKIDRQFQVELTSEIQISVDPSPKAARWEDGVFYPAEQVYVYILDSEGPNGLQIYEDYRILTAENPIVTFQYTPYRGSCPPNGQSIGFRKIYNLDKKRYELQSYDLRMRIIAVRDSGGVDNPVPLSLPLIDPYAQMHDNKLQFGGKVKGNHAWTPPPYPIPPMPAELQHSYDCYANLRYDILPEGAKSVPSKKCVGLLDQRFPNLSVRLVNPNNPNDVNDPEGTVISIPGGEEIVAFYNAHNAGIDYLFTGYLNHTASAYLYGNTYLTGSQYAIDDPQKIIGQYNLDGTLIIWLWNDVGLRPGMLDSGDFLWIPNLYYDPLTPEKGPERLPGYLKLADKLNFKDNDCSLGDSNCTVCGPIAFDKFGTVSSGDSFNLSDDEVITITTYGVPTYLRNYGEAPMPSTDTGGDLYLALLPRDALTKLQVQVYTYNVIYDYNSSIKHPPYYIIDEADHKQGYFDDALQLNLTKPGSGLNRHLSMGIDYCGIHEFKVLAPDPYVNFAEFVTIDHALQNSQVNYTSGVNALSTLPVPTPQIAFPYNPIVLDVAKDLRGYPGGQSHTGRVMGGVLNGGYIRSDDQHSGWNAYPAIWWWNWYEGIEYNNFTDFNKLGTEFYPLTDYGTYFILKDIDGYHLSLTKGTDLERLIRRIEITGPFARPKVYDQLSNSLLSRYRYNNTENVPIVYDWSGKIIIDASNQDDYEMYWESTMFGRHTTIDLLPNNTYKAAEIYNWSNVNGSQNPYPTQNPFVNELRLLDYRGLNNIWRIEEYIPISQGRINIKVILADGTVKIFQDCCAEPPTDGVEVHALTVNTDTGNVHADTDNKVTATIKETEVMQTEQLCNDAYAYIWQDRGVINRSSNLYDGAGDGWVTNPPHSSAHTELQQQYLMEEDLNNDGKISFREYETEIMGTYDLATNTWNGGVIDARTFHRNNGEYVFDLSESNGARVNTVGLDFGGAKGVPDHVISDYERLPIMITAYKYGDDNNDRAFTPLYGFPGTTPQFSHEVYLSGQKFLEVTPLMDLSVSVQPNPLTAGVTPELVDPVSPLSFVLTNEEGNPVDLSRGVPDNNGESYVEVNDIWNYLFDDIHPATLPEYYWLRTDLHNDDNTRVNNRYLYSTSSSPFQPIIVDFSMAKDGKYAFRGFCANDEGSFDVFIYTPDRKHAAKATVNVVLPTAEWAIVNTEDPASTEYQVPGEPDFVLTAADCRLYRIRVTAKNAQGLLLKGVTKGVSTCGGGIKNTARFTPYTTRPASYDFTERDRYLFAEHFLQDLYPYTLNIGFDFNDNGKLDIRNSELYGVGTFTHTMNRTGQRTLGQIYYNTTLFRFDEDSIHGGWDVEPNPNLVPPMTGWGLGAIYNSAHRGGYLFADIDPNQRLDYHDSLGLDVNAQTTFYIFAEDLVYLGGLIGDNVYCNNPAQADLAGYPPAFKTDPATIYARFDPNITPDGVFFLDWEAFPNKEIEILPPQLQVLEGKTRAELSKNFLNSANYDLTYALETHMIVQVRPADLRDMPMKEGGRVFMIGNQHQTAIYGNTQPSPVDNKVMETTLHFTPTGLGENVAYMGYFRKNCDYLVPPYDLKNTSTYTLRNLLEFDSVTGLQLEVYAEGILNPNKTSTIQAKVTDIGTNAPVEGATVTLKGPGVNATAKTNKEGYANFTVTPNDKGVILVTANMDGKHIGSAEIRVVPDTTAPWLEVNPLPPLTNKAQVEVSGQTNPGNTVGINNQTVQVDNDGSFKGMVALKEGLNTIIVEAKNKNDMKVRKMVTITLDTTPPNLFIDDPGYLVAIGKQASLDVEITGRVEPDSKVTVNNIPAKVTHDIFKTEETKIALKPGKNTLTVVAVDAAGNGATVTKEILVYKRMTIQLTIDNKEPIIDDEKQPELEAAPFISGGRTMVPVRFIAEAYGAKVDYDATTKGITITLDETVIAMQVGVKTAYVNGKSYTIDAPPVIVNGRTFVPIRFISEMFNATVTYEQATRTVTIVRDFLPK